MPLRPIKQRSGKTVHAWLVACDLDVSQINSNNFSMEWPPRSGKMQEFAEIDRAEWFTLDIAKEKIFEAQRPLVRGANVPFKQHRTCRIKTAKNAKVAKGKVFGFTALLGELGVLAVLRVMRNYRKLSKRRHRPKAFHRSAQGRTRRATYWELDRNSIFTRRGSIQSVTLPGKL